MVFLWFSYGFPMVFLWFSYGFPMVFRWFSDGFPMDFLWIHQRLNTSTSFRCPGLVGLRPMPLGLHRHERLGPGHRSGRGLRSGWFHGTPKPWENHRKTIGKWEFNGMLWDVMGPTLC